MNRCSANMSTEPTVNSKEIMTGSVYLHAMRDGLTDDVVHADGTDNLHQHHHHHKDDAATSAMIGKSNKIVFIIRC